MRRFIALALAAPLLALPALAEAPRLPDIARLEALDATLGRALKGAFAEGPREGLAVLTAALAGAPGPLDPGGDWQCRTLKLGGFLPLVAYGNFACRITPDGAGGWVLEKTTGSQRQMGTLTPQEGGALYTGVGYVSGGPAVRYDALPPDDQTPVEPGQTIAQVGLFEQMSPNRARLLLPLPLLESDFDILYLTR
jgi:hypothetical protein